MVGVKKITLDLEELDFPVKAYSIEKKARVIKRIKKLRDLLAQYYEITIFGEGSRQHAKAGLSKNKVLIQAYGIRNRSEKKN